MDNELITIVEDEEYKKCFIIIINRYPDYPVRFDPTILSNNRSIVLDKLEEMLSGITTINRIFIYNEKYEYYLEQKFSISLYYNLIISIDRSINYIKVSLVLTDNDAEIESESELSQEESNELVNKLLDLNEIIKQGEI